MSIIIVSDVFGLTPALLKIADKLEAISIIDTYQGKMMEFENEEHAYSCFVKTVGLDNYFSVLLQAVESSKHTVTLIGFSVGASVVWRLSEIKDEKFIKQAFCYYGSQIRKFTEIEPCFDINLVFPACESHFDVLELQNTLMKKNNVKIKKVKYLHGFMNYHSSNYNDDGYTEHLSFLCSAVN